MIRVWFVSTFILPFQPTNALVATLHMMERSSWSNRKKGYAIRKLRRILFRRMEKGYSVVVEFYSTED